MCAGKKAINLGDIVATNPRPKLKTSLLKRVTPDTKFCIDYEWWEKSDLDLKSYLYSRLSIESDVEVNAESDEIDLVNTETGKVHRVDGFQFMIQTYFSQLPEDFMEQSSVVDAIFYSLLANANQPLSANELAEKINRPVQMIIKTIGGTRIYQGIRPILN